MVKRMDVLAKAAPAREEGLFTAGGDAEFLAHLILATAVTRAWPRNQWFVHADHVEDDGRVHYLPNAPDILDMILNGKQVVSDGVWISWRIYK
jgi:hypothetical protein